MALKRDVRKSFEYLSTLEDQQLQSMLVEEMESEDIDTDFIKTITSVLASKEEPTLPETDAAFERFVSEYMNTEPLYDEVIEEINQEETPPPHKVFRLSRLLKVGIAVAATVVLLLSIGIVANARGVDLWHAITEWTASSLGRKTDPSQPVDPEEDPFFDFKTALNQIDGSYTIPSYFPKGYTVSDVITSEVMDGTQVICTLRNGEHTLVINYLFSSDEPVRVYPKDDEEPTEYESKGIKYVISTNEGYYRAIWRVGNWLCDISGVDTEEELLKIIDSIT